MTSCKRCAKGSSERRSVLPKGTQLGSIRMRIPSHGSPYTHAFVPRNREVISIAPQAPPSNPNMHTGQPRHWPLQPTAAYAEWLDPSWTSPPSLRNKLFLFNTSNDVLLTPPWGTVGGHKFLAAFGCFSASGPHTSLSLCNTGFLNTLTLL